MRARTFLAALDQNAEHWALLVFYAMVVATMAIEVVRREVLAYSSIWGEEAVRYAFIWLAWIGAAAAVKDRAHIRIDVLFGFLPPRGKALLYILGDLAMLGVGLARALLVVRDGGDLLALRLGQSRPCASRWSGSTPPCRSAFSSSSCASSSPSCATSATSLPGVPSTRAPACSTEGSKAMLWQQMQTETVVLGWSFYGPMLLDRRLLRARHPDLGDDRARCRRHAVDLGRAAALAHRRGAVRRHRRLRADRDPLVHPHRRRAGAHGSVRASSSTSPTR